MDVHSSKPIDVVEVRRQFLGCEIRKAFGQHGVYVGRVKSVTDKLVISGTIQKGIFVHVRYEDGDAEDLTLEEFQALRVCQQGAIMQPKRRTIKRPARYIREDEDEADVPAEHDAAPATSKPAAIRTPGSGEKENRAPAAVKLERGTGPAVHPQPKPAVKLQMDDAEAAPPQPKRQKKTPKERVDASLVVEPPPAGESQPMDAESAEGFRQRTRGLAGHLYRIKLQNFMCHSHFEMDFGPHVTFISGTNGSGKSAVLQALQFCLGVQAAKTGRAGSNTNFIKTGCHQAKVSVTLWNTGDDAYRPEAYGDFISITRQVTRSGGTSYQAGRTVSKERDEMHAIVDHLSIDAANPIAVMTQDTSRGFLSGSGEAADRRKYDLFMQATSLAKVEEELGQAEASIAQQGDALMAEKPKLKALRAQAKELEASLERLQALENWRNRSNQLTHALAWAQVDEVAEQVSTAEEKLQKLQAMGGEQLEAAIRQVQADVEAQAADVKAQQDAMANFNTMCEALAEEAQALQTEHTNAKRKRARLERALDKLRHIITEKESEKQSLVEAAAESQAEYAAEAAAYDAEVKRQQLETEDLRQKALKLNVRVQSMAEQFTIATDCLMDAETTVQRNHIQVSRLQRQLQEAKRHEGSRLAQFGGPAMVELAEAVRREAGFHREPIGPIGAVLSLSDPRWGTAVDTAIGEKLTNWVCHDTHDRQLLGQLARRANLARWLSISVIRFDIPRHTLPAARVPPKGLTTVLQVLTCSHPNADTIFNILVDQHKIEHIVLCSSVAEAQQAIHAPNVYTAYCEDGSKRYKRRSTLAYNPYRPGNRKQGKLGEDAAAFLKHLETALAAAQDEVLSAEADVAERKAARAEASQGHREARAQAQACRVEQNNAETQLDLLQSQPPAASQVKDVIGDSNDEASVQVEIEEKAAAIWDLQQSVASEAENARAARDEEDQAQHSHASKRAEIGEAKQRNEQRLAEMTAQLAALEAKEAACENMRANRHTLDALVGEWEEVRRGKRKQHEKDTELARQVCTREQGQAALEELTEEAVTQSQAAAPDKNTLIVPLPISPLGLSATRQRLEQRLNKQLKEVGGNSAELELQLGRVRRRYDDLQNRMRNVVEAHNVALEGLDKRRVAVAERHKLITNRVKNACGELLARKGHLGSLSFKEGKLEMRVQVAGSSEKAGKCKDMKQLSGGERSFSTVALTLALGEFANSPFRACDEPDVFMDTVNRTMAIASHLGFACQLHELQDVAAVEEAKAIMCKNEGIEVQGGFVHVVRMQPARVNADQA